MAVTGCASTVQRVDPYGAVPDDFSVDLTILVRPQGERADQRSSRIMVEADGTLRYQADPDMGPNTVPPMVRRLDREQLARIWDSAARLGLTDPTQADPTANLLMVDKPVKRGSIWMLVITGQGDRWNFTRRAEGDSQPDAAIVTFGRELAALAWAPDELARTAPTEPERWNYGADPWAAWRGEEVEPMLVSAAPADLAQPVLPPETRTPKRIPGPVITASNPFEEKDHTTASRVPRPAPKKPDVVNPDVSSETTQPAIEVTKPETLVASSAPSVREARTPPQTSTAPAEVRAKPSGKIFPPVPAPRMPEAVLPAEAEEVREVRLPPPPRQRTFVVTKRPEEVLTPPSPRIAAPTPVVNKRWPIDFGSIRIAWAMSHPDLPAQMGCDAWPLRIVLRDRVYMPARARTTEPPLSIREINALGGGVADRAVMEFMRSGIQTCAEASGLLGADVEAKIQWPARPNERAVIWFLVSVPLSGTSAPDLPADLSDLPKDASP